MALAQKVTELDVYKLAFDVQQQVFQRSKGFPLEEKYALTDQIRRSSRSLGANICEAWRKRNCPAHFRSKRTDSDGETEETCHWLRTAVSCGYLAHEEGRNMAAIYPYDGFSRKRDAQKESTGNIVLNCPRTTLHCPPSTLHPLPRL